jgi:transposase
MAKFVERKLIAIEAVAAWIGVPVDWIRNLTGKHCPVEARIPFIRVRGEVVFDASEVAAWVADRCRSLRRRHKTRRVVPWDDYNIRPTAPSQKTDLQSAKADRLAAIDEAAGMLKTAVKVRASEEETAEIDGAGSVKESASEASDAGSKNDSTLPLLTSRPACDTDVTSSQWDNLKCYLGLGDRRRREAREILNGILWKLRTGREWHELPDRHPPAEICIRRFKRWIANGRMTIVSRVLGDPAVPLFIRPTHLARGEGEAKTPAMRVAPKIAGAGVRVPAAIPAPKATSAPASPATAPMSERIKAATEDPHDRVDLISNFVPSSTMNLVIGGYGIGKTALVAQIAVAVAAGVAFLGHPTKPANVIAYDFEHGPDKQFDTVRSVADHLNVSDSTLKERLRLFNQDIGHKWTGNTQVKIQYIRDGVKEFPAALVVVDALGYYHGALNYVVRELSLIASAYGTAFVLVGHFDERWRPLALTPPHNLITVDRLSAAGDLFIGRSVRSVDGERLPFLYANRVFDDSGRPRGYDLKATLLLRR